MEIADRYNLIGEMAQVIMANREFEKMFSAVCDLMAKQFPQMDDFGLTRYDAEKESFEVVATYQQGSDSTNKGTKTDATENSPGGFLMKMGRTMMINDFDAFSEQAGVDFRALFPRNFESGIGGLLEHGEKVLGYIYITSMEKNKFTEEEKEFFDSIRTMITLAFENVLAFDTITKLKEQAEMEGEYLREEIKESFPDDGLVGVSDSWKHVIHQVNQVASTESTVLIQGETGTGKEVVARAVHERSRRAKKPLIKINCGALPENLVESELFGHEKGSFTGALGRRVGRFELADGGTIFLDEIGEMPMSLQVKLLRVLQEREFERVGGEKPIRVNVRVITATNRDLSTEVAAGRFRADLYYRLNVFPISIPPLRTRPEDALDLAQYFLSRISKRMGRKPLKLTDESVQAIRNYSFPGNVRELEHLIERAIILSNSYLADVKSLLMPTTATTAFPDSTSNIAPVKISEPVEKENFSLKETFKEAERSAIEKALIESNFVVGGKNGAATKLGLKRQTLQSKMKKLDIDVQALKNEASTMPTGT